MNALGHTRHTPARSVQHTPARSVQVAEQLGDEDMIHCLLASGAKRRGIFSGAPLAAFWLHCHYMCQRLRPFSALGPFWRNARENLRGAAASRSPPTFSLNGSENLAQVLCFSQLGECGVKVTRCLNQCRLCRLYVDLVGKNTDH